MTSHPASIFLIPILLLWTIFMVIVLRETYRLFKKREWVNAIVFCVIIAMILFFTGGWVIFSLFVLGCEAGLVLPCLL